MSGLEALVGHEITASINDQGLIVAHNREVIRVRLEDFAGDNPTWQYRLGAWIEESDCECGIVRRRRRTRVATLPRGR